MKLAIVLPVLNEGAGLLPRLQALAPLRERGARVTVVDGGSAGGVPAFVTPLVDEVLSAPRGRASQMNAGAWAAGQAGAEVLLFLHADTALPPMADQLIHHALTRGADWGRFDVRIEGRHPLLPMVGALMNWRSRLSGIATGDQAMFVKRDVFQRLGGFADQPLMEDIDLSRRLRALRRPACLRARVVTSGRRWDSHGAWPTIVLMWRLRWRYWRGVAPDELAKAYR